MDRSMDSIGSCSLDVDAESSDISDTSGSLNFATPISIKDITREFTTNIRERCSVHTVKNTTAFVNPATGQVCIALAQTTVGGGGGGGDQDTGKNTLGSPQAVEEGYEKKPSYLNLACCVNGYSNITTYDSKIRQDINKSREVSPIRPSSSSLQYCKKSNSLAPPLLLTMPDTDLTSPRSVQSSSPNSASQYATIKNGNHVENGSGTLSGERTAAGDHGEMAGSGGRRSFIQQRVERLYGPGALAQGFYSPKKKRDLLHTGPRNESPEAEGSTELSRKFQELSPSKDYNEFRRKLGSGGRPLSVVTDADNESGNNKVDLPCLRHLSQEFRAQLPTISPKRNVARISPGRSNNVVKIENGTTEIAIEVVGHAPTKEAVGVDEVDRKIVKTEHCIETVVETPAALVGDILKVPPTEASKSIVNTTDKKPAESNGTVAKDGNYFLQQLRSEQSRLLNMAAEAEKYIDALSSNPEITEDVLGLLRSASGKARLLVSQKMKQFEGLCHNNLNRSSEDKFPTTVDDLQGFWDMVYLQVDHINVIFAEIETLKKNDWKKPTEANVEANQNAASKSQRLPTKSPLSHNKAKSNASVANGSPKSNSSPSAAALKREAQRKKLQEIKRRNREAMALAASTANDSCSASSPAAADAEESIPTAGGEDNS